MIRRRSFRGLGSKVEILFPFKALLEIFPLLFFPKWAQQHFNYSLFLFYDRKSYHYATFSLFYVLNRTSCMSLECDARQPNTAGSNCLRYVHKQLNSLRLHQRWNSLYIYFRNSIYKRSITPEPYQINLFIAERNFIYKFI